MSEPKPLNIIKATDQELRDFFAKLAAKCAESGSTPVVMYVKENELYITTVNLPKEGR